MTKYDVNEKRKEWERFYEVIFSRFEICSDLIIPECSNSVDDLVIVAKGIKLEDIFRKYKKFNLFHTDCKKLPNFLEREDERCSLKDSYAFWHKGSKELMIKEIFSGKQIKKLGIKSMTLTERLLWGML